LRLSKPQRLVRQEGLDKLKTFSLSGLEHATFRLVAKRRSLYATDTIIMICCTLCVNNND
jgi:hypothetical protein